MDRPPGRWEVGAPVVVLRVHHGSLGIARTLGRLGVPVHAVYADLQSPGLASRYWRGRYPWDFAGSSPSATVEFLLELGKGLGRPAVLVPTSDDTAGLVAEHGPTLRERYLFQENPIELVRALSNKRDLHLLACRNAIPTPHTVFPRSLEDVRAFAAGTGFPLMLKASDGLQLQARTGKRMVIVRSAEDLERSYLALEDPAQPNLMIQEYIPGGDDTIWMFNGYFDRNSDCVVGITGRKLRQFPVHTGATSLGICEDNPVVAQLTTSFVKAIGYRGILDIGFRYDARDTRYKLLDPNPRIGSSFRLFVTRDGHDVARYLYWDLTGQALPPSPAGSREARKWLVEDQDVESCLDYRREGTLSWLGWVRSYRGVEESAWFAWDDLRPFARMAREFLGRAWRYGRKRLLGSPERGR